RPSAGIPATTTFAFVEPNASRRASYGAVNAGSGRYVTNGASRPLVPFNTSLPPSSTDTTVGCCANAAASRVAVGGGPRDHPGALAPFDSGVLCTTSTASAPASPTFCVGSVTPCTLSAHTVLTEIDSPLKRNPAPSGATIGEMQPGD